MGSGGMVITDEDTCMVDFARYFMTFVQEESVRQVCAVPRGHQSHADVLERICAGKGQAGVTWSTWAQLGQQVKRASLCGLGQTAPNPVLSTIRYFRDEYEAHIQDMTCPAKVCKGLITYSVISERCTGCMVCLRNCPGEAITGGKKQCT